MKGGVVDLLIGAWRREQDSSRLQALPTTMHVELTKITASLLSRLANEVSGSLQASIIQKELEVINYAWEDLLRIRRAKIEATMRKRQEGDLDHLLDVEVKYMDAFGALLGEYAAGTSLSKVMPTGKKVIETESYILVRMLVDTVPIMGTDQRVYGPFKREDLVYMPRENGVLLVSDKMAQEVVL